MDILSILLIIAGLVLFETITSIDNAIINAEVLSTMGQRARRWFLTWGLLIAVFAIRGFASLADCLDVNDLSGPSWGINCNILK